MKSSMPVDEFKIRLKNFEDVMEKEITRHRNERNHESYSHDYDNSVELNHHKWLEAADLLRLHIEKNLLYIKKRIFRKDVIKYHDIDLCGVEKSGTKNYRAISLANQILNKKY